MRTPFLVLMLIILTGCVHRIEVHPLPSIQATKTIARTIQIVVTPPTLEGADHRPGITLLEWPHDNLRQAVTHYAQHRRTFRSVSSDQADLLLHITTKLALASRKGRYHYSIQLHAEIRETDHLVKAYQAEATIAGSLARWVSASDRDPTHTALQTALDDLFIQIEQDDSLYGTDRDGSNQP